MKPSELFYFKDKKNFAVSLFFLVACNKKFQRENATDIASDGNDPPDDWLKTRWARDSQTRARLVDSLICITCALENNALSVLHYVMAALHYSMLHRFEIFSAPGIIAHGSIRLLVGNNIELKCRLSGAENITSHDGMAPPSFASLWIYFEGQRLPSYTTRPIYFVTLRPPSYTTQ